MAVPGAGSGATTLRFEDFWQWLASHPNCILRAGTPEVVLYDDEDLHWHFGRGDGERRLVQLLRGKRLVGEILVEPSEVAYVEAFPGDVAGEHGFDLIAESESERFAAYYFVLVHGFGEDEPVAPARVH